MRKRSVVTRMLMIVLMAVAVAVMFPVAAAIAAEAAAPAASGLLGSVMSLIAIVASGVVVWAGTLLAKKLGFDLDAAKLDSLRKVAKDGIYYAEEWAAKKFSLDQTAASAASGAEKLNNAVGFVLAKIPGADTAEVKDAIHAALGSIQGLGASKAVGETKTT